MAAIDNTLAVRDVAAHLMKRANFASRNPGVMYVPPISYGRCRRLSYRGPFAV